MFNFILMFDLRDLELMFADRTDLLINSINKFLNSKKKIQLGGNKFMKKELTFLKIVSKEKEQFQILVAVLDI